MDYYKHSKNKIIKVLIEERAGKEKEPKSLFIIIFNYSLIQNNDQTKSTFLKEEKILMLAQYPF